MVYTILIFCAACAILPFLLLIISSFTSEESLAVYGYSFWPREWSLYSYKWLFSTNGARVFRAYGVTIFITVVGTGLSLLIAPLLAYPLSRRDYKRRNFFTFVVFFTMLFNGGVSPPVHHVDSVFPHQGHHLGLDFSKFALHRLFHHSVQELLFL